MNIDTKEEHCTVEDELGCNCGHCKSGVTKQKESSNSFKDFFRGYGASFLRIFIGLILFLVTIFFDFELPYKMSISVLSVLIINYEVVIDFFKSIFKFRFFDENALMFIASLAAFIICEYHEAVLIVMLFTFGELLEKIATDNSKKKIAGLKDLRVQVCRLVSKTGIQEVNPEIVEVGSLIEVSKGGRIPIDGVLLGGGAVLNMMAITGESKPYEIKSGENVYSGSINMGESIIVKTTKNYCDSTVEKIIQMVEGSLSKKATSQKFIKKFAKYYTPIVVLVGLVIALLVPVIIGGNMVEWIYKALNFIVISCPCALVISVPLAFFIGIGNMSRKGILVKGSCYIEQLPKIKTVVFDKTGTITEGKLKVNDVVVVDDKYNDKLNEYLYLMESKSAHPLSKAILEYLGKIKLDGEVILNAKINEIAGKGIVAFIDNCEFFVGNCSLARDYSVVCEDDREKTTVFFGKRGQLIARIYLQDSIKENASQALSALRKIGVNKLIMISGDSQGVVNEVSRSLNLDESYSQMLPDEKVKKLKEIIDREEGGVMYVGDGINDSPSITLADVGVSMGAMGSEIAIETADVVIMDDNLAKLSTAIKKSSKIKRKVIENIVASLAIKFSVMILSICVALPIWVAMFADVGVMLLAVGNSLLLNIKDKKGVK